MKINTKEDFTKYNSAQDIFEKLRATRSLEIGPAKPTLESLIKAFGLKKTHLTKIHQLVSQHLKQDHDILVYGDYDADGITATTILWTALTKLAKGSKARILPFIPDRTKHGYGLSKRALKDIFSGLAFGSSAYPNFAPQLFITVDNGIVATGEVKTLKARAIDVIITDHHQPGDPLPPANVILHSQVSSGAGLAWVLALSLTASAPEIFALIEIATIGIVADQLPLTDINRAIVTHGLQALSQTNNAGLRALSSIAGIKDQIISTYHINFVLAPRLNAAGRLADATDALRLLCTHDSAIATKLATKINAHNEARQALTEEGIKLALNKKPTHQLIISASKAYHEGVIGLIAGRLAEEYHLPAIAISLGSELSKGSARSVAGVDITALLRHFAKYFVGLGGHQLAAGFSIKSAKLKKLIPLLTTYADTHLDQKLLIPSFSVDGLLTLGQTSLALTNLLEDLAPFGLGNPKPRFVSHNLQVIEDRQLGDSGKHRRLTITQNGVTRQAVWFNCQADYPILSIKDLVFTLDVNVWKGKESLQLLVKHANL